MGRADLGSSQLDRIRRAGARPWRDPTAGERGTLDGTAASRTRRAILGIPGGIELIEAADPDRTTTLAPLWQLLAVVPATVLVVAGLTAIPARLGARRAVAGILAAEHS